MRTADCEDQRTQGLKDEGYMIKRSVVVQGHATSVRLESQFWEFIDDICKKQDISLAQLIISIEKQQQVPGNLASKLRVFCLENAMGKQLSC